MIRIEPGMAFGTGTHETTRLCLLAIETYFRANSFLDVGTGTGILAIAAAKLAPAARVEACDTDPDAIAIARENARLNGVGERIRFWVGTVEESTTSASCVCANLTADVILPLLPALIGASCERLILSGSFPRRPARSPHGCASLASTITKSRRTASGSRSHVTEERQEKAGLPTCHSSPVTCHSLVRL